MIPQDGGAARAGAPTRRAVRQEREDLREDLVVARLRSLAPHLDGEPDPAYRSTTRARLVAMAAVRAPAPAPTSSLRRLLARRAEDVAPSRWRTRLTAGLAGAALTVTAAASLVALAVDARPGDVLYGVKRGTEQTQLALAGDARGQTLLDMAGTRLEELTSLLGEGAATAGPVAAGSDGPRAPAAGGDTALILPTIDAMDAETTDGAAWLTQRAVTTADAGPLDALSAWATRQSAGLAGLRSRVPEDAALDVADSLALLSGITTRTAALRPALTCTGGPSTAGSDRLGPVPAPCTSPATIPRTDGAAPGSAPRTWASAPPGSTPGTRASAPPSPAPSTRGAPDSGSGNSRGTGVPGLGGGLRASASPRRRFRAPAAACAPSPCPCPRRSPRAVRQRRGRPLRHPRR